MTSKTLLVGAMALALAGCAGETGTEPPTGPFGVDGKPDGTQTAPEAIDEGITVVSLGEIELDAGGLSPSISLTVPEGVRSFMVIIEGSPETYYRVNSIKNPDGTELINNEEPEASANRSRWGTLAGGGAMLLPNTDSAEVAATAGEWKLALRSWQSTEPMMPHTARVKVLFKSGPRTADRGRLHVYLHFSGALGVTAEAATSTPAIVDALEIMKTIYSDAGIEVVVHEDWTDDAPEHVIDLQGPEGLDQLTTQVTRHDGVNVFFIHQLGGEIDYRAEGISAGLPGIPYTSGTSMGAVAIALADGFNPPYRLKHGSVIGHVLAHEVGHFLGLRHTGEIGGGADPISDTDEFERRNLMFTVTGGEEISAGQARVLLNNPLIELVDAEPVPGE